MKTDWILYFGYGSLVNRETRPAQEIAYPARLKGWRRVWEHRVTHPNRDKRCTSLSIESFDTGQFPASAAGPAAIDGVVVRLPLSDLHQLDEREAGYERLTLPISDFDLPQVLTDQLLGEMHSQSVMVYRSLPHNRALADDDHPVLQSYIDCVMAGFLRCYGESGVQAMISSTRGWERAIFNDRDEPYYPRWVPVAQERQQYFDSCIERHVSQLDAA